MAGVLTKGEVTEQVCSLGSGAGVLQRLCLSGIDVDG